MTDLAVAAALLACAGMLICSSGLIAVRRFARPGGSKRAGPKAHPPVTILKPLCGAEPLLEEALESSFNQAYPEFQIVFGVHDPSDPALEVVERVRARFPARDIHVVIDSTLYGPNRKVSNLINMLPFAKHDVLVISDSDLHVPPNYLDNLVAELEESGTGMVTSLYVGVPATRKGWVAALGASQINHQFLPGVLLSRALGRQDCLGSTAIFRRETLERVGGFHPLTHLLAEDNVLGQQIRRLGLSIRLADIVPAAMVPETSFKPLWRHEMRWTRTNRELAPVATGASVIQYPLLWSIVAMLCAGGSAWSVALFVASWAVRAVCARSIDSALRHRVGRQVFKTSIWLLPVRDILSFVEIVSCFWVEEVTWRGHKLTAVAAKSPVAALTIPHEPESLLREN